MDRVLERSAGKNGEVKSQAPALPLPTEGSAKATNLHIFPPFRQLLSLFSGFGIRLLGSGLKLHLCQYGRAPVMNPSPIFHLPLPMEEFPWVEAR